MADPIRIISSMATKQVLADLVAQYTKETRIPVTVESVGGVDAAKRVQSGEAFDLVMLAANVINQLSEAGHVVAGSRVDIVNSGVAAAVKAGASQPDISTEEAVRQAVLAAKSLSYSTGPSGVALARLFERWGIAEQIAPRIVQAKPGVPVGSLVAGGEVELGFQQLSEMLNLKGIDVVGSLPPAIQIMTMFSGGIATTSRQPDAVRALLAYLASPAADATKKQQGMEPA